MLVGDRIELLVMPEDEHPIPAGSQGTVTAIRRIEWPGERTFFQIDVDWDNGRNLMLCTPPDIVRVLD